MSLNINEENLDRWLCFFVDEHLKEEPVKKKDFETCIEEETERLENL